MIPAYESARTVGQAVDSALAQTYVDLEVVVVDDGSPRNHVPHRLESLDRVRVIRLESNSGGPGRPRNIGTAAARGHYVAFLDADDVWYPEKIERQLREMKRLGVAAGCSNARAIAEGRPSIRLLERVPPLETSLGLRSLLDANYIVTSSAIISRSVLESILPFPECGGSLYEDYAMWLRAATLTRFAYIDAPLLDYSDNPSFSFRSKYAEDTAARAATLRDYQVWSLRRSLYGLTLASAALARHRAVLTRRKLRSRLNAKRH